MALCHRFVRIKCTSLASLGGRGSLELVTFVDHLSQASVSPVEDGWLRLPCPGVYAGDTHFRRSGRSSLFEHGQHVSCPASFAKANTCYTSVAVDVCD